MRHSTFLSRGKTIVIMMAIALVSTTSLTSLLSTPAFAEPADDSSTNPDDWLPTTRAARWAHLTGLYRCINGAWDGGDSWRNGTFNDRIEEGSASSGDWFMDPIGPRDRQARAASFVKTSVKRDDGKTDCNTIVSLVMSDYSMSGIELACGLGATREDGSPCVNSGTKSKFKPPPGSSKATLDVSKVWGTKNLSSNAGGAAYYQLNLQALLSPQGCSLKEDSAASGEFAYSLSIVNEKGEISTKKYTGQKKSHTTHVYTSYPGVHEQERSCETIATDLSKQSAEYAKWVKGHLESSDDNNDGGTDGSTTATNCAIDNIGWILCPVMSFMAKVVDGAYGMVESLLGVQPITTDDTDTSLYSAWGTMRNLANVAFVIAFLIVIYSQITGVGITNYGIKKLLPKIIIAAILVNLSYWICAIAIDLSNIAGASLKGLFDSMSATLTAPEFDTNTASTSWEGLTATVLAGIAVVGIALALPSLLPALVIALLAIVTVFLVLTIRQALIILLVVVSPLAFVAYLLPNTEGWFQKWRKLFQTLLLMYPIIAIMFGAAAFASKIVMNSATDENGDGIFAVQVMGALITIIPLALTPVIMKAAGGVFDRFGAFVNNPNKGPFDRLRKKADAAADRRRSNRTARGIARGQRWGNAARKSGIGRRIGSLSDRTQAAIQGSNTDSKFRSWAASKYGSVATRASGAIDFVGSAGAVGAMNAEERSKYAKISSDAAKRNYVSERAASSDAYAASIGGKDNVALVQAYARKAVREEERKDIEAVRERLATASTNSFVSDMVGAGSKEEMAAYAAEIAARGPGRQFHEALEASRGIADADSRRLVQSQLLSNMREDHFGVSDEMRGRMATGDIDANWQVENDGVARKDAKGGSFSGIYEASVDSRLEHKSSAEKIVSMKAHDMKVAMDLATSERMTDGALQRMVDVMHEAEQNENTRKEIKGETEQMFIAAKQLASKRGITVSTPSTPSTPPTSPSGGGGAGSGPTSSGGDGTILSWS